MRLIFVVWLVVILYSASNLGMLSHGDVGGWLGRSLGVALPLFAIYYLVQWVRKKKVSE